MTNRYLRGKPVRLLSSTLNEAGTHVDPATLTLAVKLPDGSTSSYSLAGATIARDSTGVFHVNFVTTLAGRHFYRWASTTPAGADEGEFVVEQGDFT